MILKVQVHGARSYAVGDEIWHESLVDAIIAEAETIATYAGCDLLESPARAHRAALRDRIIGEMTSALVSAGDEYRAPDGVLYSLIDEPMLGPLAGEGRLSPVSSRPPEPIVDQVLRFEDLPLGSAGTRRAIVRWSDGTESVAMTWYGDEILVCEGDLIGKRQAKSARCTSAEIATGSSRRGAARRGSVAARWDALR
jgi:hypothetical protein